MIFHGRAQLARLRVIPRTSSCPDEHVLATIQAANRASGDPEAPNLPRSMEVTAAPNS